ncbi:hypothetical protein SAMN05428950_101896 [Sphingomonas sp. OV641]|nr:hypothetical protein SAMN05428950_101896 [Sphingomonas sp. OV641]
MRFSNGRHPVDFGYGFGSGTHPAVSLGHERFSPKEMPTTYTVGAGAAQSVSELIVTG